MVVVNWLPPRKVEPVSHTDSTIAVLKMVVVNWLPPGKVKPVSHMDNTIAMLMIGRSYLATT